MVLSSEDQQKIIRDYALLIHQAVQAIRAGAASDALLRGLEMVRHTPGGETLADAILQRIAPKGAYARPHALSPRDTAVMEAIERGVQDPATLPDITESVDPTRAAPGLAAVIAAARRGDTQANTLLSLMQDQMAAFGGDMARVALVLAALRNGDADDPLELDTLSSEARSLIRSVQSELTKFTLH